MANTNHRKHEAKKSHAKRHTNYILFYLSTGSWLSVSFLLLIFNTHTKPHTHTHTHTSTHTHTHTQGARLYMGQCQSVIQRGTDWTRLLLKSHSNHKIICLVKPVKFLLL